MTFPAKLRMDRRVARSGGQGMVYGQKDEKEGGGRKVNRAQRSREFARKRQPCNVRESRNSNSRLYPRR